MIEPSNHRQRKTSTDIVKPSNSQRLLPILELCAELFIYCLKNIKLQSTSRTKLRGSEHWRSKEIKFKSTYIKSRYVVHPRNDLPIIVETNAYRLTSK